MQPPRLEIFHKTRKQRIRRSCETRNRGTPPIALQRLPTFPTQVIIDAVQDKDSAIANKHVQRNSCAPCVEPSCCRSCEVFHPVDFGLKLPPSCRCEAVTLLVPRGVLEVHRLDPAALQKTADCSEQRARAHPDASTAQCFDVFQQRVSMARLIGQTGQYQNHGL
jgi:hypothetical protein